jgi:hypothetical protein
VSLAKWFVLFYCFYRLYLQRSRGSRTAGLMGLLNYEDKDNTVLQNNRNHSTSNRATIPEPGILNFNRFRNKYLPYKTYVTLDVQNPGAKEVLLMKDRCPIFRI